MWLLRSILILIKNKHLGGHAPTIQYPNSVKNTISKGHCTRNSTTASNHNPANYLPATPKPSYAKIVNSGTKSTPNNKLLREKISLLHNHVTDPANQNGVVKTQKKTI